MSYLVFPAGPGDAEALARVHVTSWRETYRGLLSDHYLGAMSEVNHARRFYRGLMAEDCAEVTLAAADCAGIVGYASGGPSRSGVAREAEIATLYVLRKAQGQNLGARLLKDTARALAARGGRSLVISVLRDNIRARGFYEHLGGEAQAPRQERGPGGLLHEVAYRWANIGVLI